MKKYSFYFKESKPFVKLMMLICIFMVLTSIAGFIFQMINLPVLATQALSQIIMFGLATFLWGIMFEGSFYGFTQTKRKNFSYFLTIGILLLVVSMPFIDGINVWNNSLHFEGEEIFRQMEENARLVMEKFMQDTSTSSLILNILVLALTPAILEEYFFRAAMQTTMIKMLRSKFFGIILTSILFSLIHFQFFSFLPRVFLGIFLGYLYVFSKNIIVPIIYHLINNLIVVLGYYLYNTKIIEKDISQIGYAYTPTLFFISILLIGGLFFIMYLLQKKEKINAQ